MRVYQDSKGNINGYSWNISNKFIQVVVMGGCLLRFMLFPLVGLYLIFHPNEGGKYAFSRKWYNKILWIYFIILPHLYPPARLFVFRVNKHLQVLPVKQATLPLQ